MKTKANQNHPRARERAVCFEGKHSARRAGDSHPRCWEQPPGHGPNQVLLDPWARSEAMAGSGSTEVAHRDLPVTNRRSQAQHRQGHCATCAAAMPSVAGWPRGAGGAQQGGPGCPKAQGLCAGSCWLPWSCPSCHGPSWKEPLLLLLIKN